MRNDDKDKFYTSDYLLGKVDPYDLMLGPSFTNSLHDELFKAKPKEEVKAKPVVKAKPIQKPQRPLPKPMTNKAPTNPPGMARGVRTVNSNRSYYDCIQRARVLDKKIKASKMPSYEDLKAFHEISKEMEEKL